MEERLGLEVLDNLHEGCQVIGADLTYQYLNDVAVEQARRPREQLLGRTMTECYPGIEKTAMFAVLLRCMASRVHERMENEFTFPDGSVGWFELRFIPIPDGLCILTLDVTDSKRAEAALARSELQLRQAQKMEAIGRLAGGVSHDFNNILSVILGCSEVLLEELPPESPTRADLNEIRRAALRAADLTRQLLSFSRQPVVETRVIDINGVIVEADRMLRRLVGKDVAMKVLAAPDLGKVKADPGQVEQVLLNLVVNARDAMPRGGTLLVETSNIDLDETFAQSHLGVVPGPHVMLAVSDTGVGMDKATQERIFEPFFTTKPKGKGTGLGLSTVFGILKQAGGSVWVYSEPGAGSTFKLFWPCTEDAPTPVVAPRPVLSVVGSETVLLVEDDDQFRALARSILRRHGYDVIEAASGDEALAASMLHGRAIDLLVTDVGMQGMNGRELADRLRPSRPTMKVLFMSGYTENAIFHHGVLSPGDAYIQKPITPETFLRKIRQLLEADAP